MENKDLTLCQKCEKNPAVYGDGVTWSECSSCHRLSLEAEQVKEPEQPESPKQGFAHEIVPDLVSIIIPVYMVNYTLFHYTGNCIGSIREHTDKNKYEIVIVDNGSPIQPPDLQSYYAHRIVKNEDNKGVTKAWNQGIRVSVGEYIVLLNNDVQVFDNWLEDLKAALDHGGFDLVMAHPMYSLTEPFARAVESKKIREKLIEESLEKGKDHIVSDFKDFSCVMFKRSLLDELGLFDETFFNYCSDSDFFRRMEKAGKKWACVETVATSHISDATGFALETTPEVMNEDKRKFEEKWANYQEIKKEDVLSEEGYKLTVDPVVAIDSRSSCVIRTRENGDKIFLIESGRAHPIKNPETLKALGFDFGDELMISKNQFEVFEKAEEVNMENYQNYV